MEHPKMSQAFIVARHPPGARARPKLSVLPIWFQRLDMWLTRRQGRKDISQLDDRMLEDVGISREDALWRSGKFLP
jgi:uncharacterized protein YjiS (DUF1127 family)